MLITDIETYLGGFTFTSAGTTFVVRRGRLPESPDAVILLADGTGMPDVRGMSASGSSPLLEVRMLEVYTRSPRADYLAGYDVADQVHQRLRWLNTTITARRYHVQAVSSPTLDGQDRNDRTVFVSTYLVHKDPG